jgi:hypothetical protein
MRGSTMISRLTLISPKMSGRSSTSNSKRETVAMVDSLPHSALEKLISFSSIRGVSDTCRSIGPAISSSRPVASRACSRARSRSCSKSKLLSIAYPAATTATDTTTRPVTNPFKRIDLTPNH